MAFIGDVSPLLLLSYVCFSLVYDDTRQALYCFIALPRAPFSTF